MSTRFNNGKPKLLRLLDGPAREVMLTLACDTEGWSRAWHAQVLSGLATGRPLLRPPNGPVSHAGYLGRRELERARRRAGRWARNNPTDPNPPAHIARHLRRVR